MHRVKGILDRILYWCTVVLFGLLVAVVVWQVFSRQVLNAPATWTEEAARMTFVWLGLFAAAFVFGERGHIAVEFLARKTSADRQRRLGATVQAVVFGFAVLILLWGGTMVMLNAWTQNLSALPFTLGQMYLALPVAGVLIAFYSLYDLRRILGGQTHAYPPIGLEDIGTGAAAQVDTDAVIEELRLLDPDPQPEAADDPAPDSAAAPGVDDDQPGVAEDDEPGVANGEADQGRRRR